MGLITVVKELWRAFFFLCSLQFWRMALLWTFSILYSYYQLFKDSLSHSQYFKPLIPEKCSLFSQKLVSYPRCSPFTTTFRPVCVITGVSLSLFFFLFIHSFFYCSTIQFTLVLFTTNLVFFFFSFWVIFNPYPTMSSTNSSQSRPHEYDDGFNDDFSSSKLSSSFSNDQE